MKTILLNNGKQKNARSLTPIRTVFFEQMQTVEALDEDNMLYTLFFYKQQYLTAVQTKRVKTRSYLAQACRQGSVYEAPHPFLQAIINENTPLQKINYPQLKKKLEDLYSLQEQAKILTYFESFIPKKQLFQDIKALFYKYRREGNMSGAYRIVRVMTDFAPNNRFVKEVGNDLSFKDQTTLYLEKPHQLTDPLWLEGTATEEDRLLLLKKEDRWIEASSLYASALTKHPHSASYQMFKDWNVQHFNSEQWTLLLEHMARSLPDFDPLIEDLFHSYMEVGDLGKLSQLVIEHQPTITREELDRLEVLTDTDEFRNYPKRLTPLMKRIAMEYPGQADFLIDKYMSALLADLDPEEVHNVIQEFPKSIPAVKKIERMKLIARDLDHMQELGEAYYEWQLLDRALECFQMEMELKPDDPQPLRWLAKVYSDKKMTDESKVYQQLCVDMQKWA